MSREVKKGLDGETGSHDRAAGSMGLQHNLLCYSSGSLLSDTRHVDRCMYIAVCNLGKRTSGCALAQKLLAECEHSTGSVADGAIACLESEPMAT